MIVNALSRDSVIDRLKADSKLKTLVRIIVSELKKDDGAKKHIIFVSIYPSSTQILY